MVGRIYHVGLTVSDLDRAIAFYLSLIHIQMCIRDRARECYREVILDNIEYSYLVQDSHIDREQLDERCV